MKNTFSVAANEVAREYHRRYQVNCIQLRVTMYDNCSCTFYHLGLRDRSCEATDTRQTSVSRTIMILSEEKNF